jgi:bifunctional ADP-heptose synthase (sugar kinase/adenylyltransferase)
VSGPTDAAGGREPAARHFLEGFRRRHGSGAVRDALATFRPLKVLVVGEAIIDEYDYCVPLGKAPKDPMISARHVKLERQAGGVLACANHLAGFCDEVDLVTSLGADDSQEAFIRDRLRPNIRPCFFLRDGASTTTKRRYVSEPGLLKMFEVAVMDDTPLPLALEDRMLVHLEATLPIHDLVVVSDYGHGFLGPRAVDLLAAGARYMAVNTQTNPANLGFHVITRYPRADYVSLDEEEARLATRDRRGALTALAGALRAHLGCPALSITRAQHGVLVSGADGSTWEIPALAHAVVDRMGVGDAYLAVSSLGAAAGLPLDVVGLLGSAAGAVALRIIGNRFSVDASAVERLLSELLP